MSNSLGHRYRAAFAVAAWMVLTFLFFYTHGGGALARHPQLRIVLISLMLLNVAFTVFTFVLWFRDVTRDDDQH